MDNNHLSNITKLKIKPLYNSCCNMQDVETSDPVTYRTTQQHWFFNVTENQNVH
jgi:hypothetical protein